MQNNQSSFILFKTEDEKIAVDVRFEDETVWLSQEQLALLFGKAKSTINEHIKNIFSEGELDEKVAVRKFRITTQHGAIPGKTHPRIRTLFIPLDSWLKATFACGESRLHAYVSYKLQPSDLLIILLPIYFVLK